MIITEQTWPRWVSESNHSAYMLREVAPDLYVGAFAAVACPGAPEWGTIISFTRSSIAYAKDYPIPPVNLQFEDGEEIPIDILDRCYSIVVHAKGPVLLHCAAGASRSVSVAYAMLRTVVRFGLTHEEALRRARDPSALEYPMPRTLASAVAWANSSAIDS